MKYCFYSRKNGYPDGDPAKFFFSQEEEDLGQNIFGNIERKYDNFFKLVVKRLKNYKPYSKIDILNLLGGFCNNNKFSIYIN